MFTKKFIKKIMITMFFIVVFLIGSSTQIFSIESTGEVVDGFGSISQITGSDFSRINYLSLGLTPYFSASMSMHILTSGISPTLTRLSNGSLKNRKALKIIEYIFMIIMGIVQASALISGATNIEFLCFGPIFVVAVLIIGSLFTKFICEKIDEKGIGSGIGVILSVNIVSVIIGSLLDLGGVYNINSKFAMSLIIVSGLTYLSWFYCKKSVSLPIRYDDRHGVKNSLFNMYVGVSGIGPIVYSSMLMNILFTFGVLDLVYKLNPQYYLIVYTLINFVIIVIFNVMSIKKAYSPKKLSDSYFDSETLVCNNSDMTNIYNAVKTRTVKAFLISTAILIAFPLSSIVLTKLSCISGIDGISIFILVSTFIRIISGIKKEKNMMETRSILQIY